MSQMGQYRRSQDKILALSRVEFDSQGFPLLPNHVITPPTGHVTIRAMDLRGAMGFPYARVSRVYDIIYNRIRVDV